jgi:transcriptional regulator with XRE-family HTH domain
MTAERIWLSEARRALRLTQCELGIALHRLVHPVPNGAPPYSRSYISKLESGQKPIPPAIARALAMLLARAAGADEAHAAAQPAAVRSVHNLPPDTLVLAAPRRCALPGCPVWFVPVTPRQKYHSPTCARTARQFKNRRV